MTCQAQLTFEKLFEGIVSIIVLEHNWNKPSIFRFALSALIGVFLRPFSEKAFPLLLPLKDGTDYCIGGPWWSAHDFYRFPPVLWIHLHSSSADSLVPIFSSCVLIFSDQSVIKVLSSSFDNISIWSLISTYPNRRGRSFGVCVNFMQQITGLDLKLVSQSRNRKKRVRVYPESSR